MVKMEELINRRPKKWGKVTIKEFERDIMKLQDMCIIYENALREIDTHIRSKPDPVPHIIETLKKNLPEYGGLNENI